METNNKKNNPIVGFLLINKPKGTNSFRCIAQIRRILKQKKLKVGYAGTLDPFATGLMIVGIGRDATKALHAITWWNKKYKASAKLGELTDTLDVTGKIIDTNDSIVTEEDLKKAIKSLGDKYEQTPPIYSALKHKGVPLYQLARHKGKTEEDLKDILKKKSRMIKLNSITLLEFNPPYFAIEADVSHGTYIRTLMNDIARIAGSCATTHTLERLSVGQLNLDNVIGLDDLKTPEDITKNLLNVEEFIGKYFSEEDFSN
ncbi:tRNA pseudouridine(55) synthase TruB [bacterium]|nr:tRNA pseudouridine(55) synthase TruB [bacterium]